MSALSLLCDYSSGSEDCDTEPSQGLRDNNLNIVLKSRLPVPTSIRTSSGDLESEGSPQDHQGRIRSFAHERGNWVTLVYISYKPELTPNQLTQNLLRHISPIGQFEESVDLHLSLSKTFVLKFHWIKEFVSNLQSSFRNTQRFDVDFNSVAIYKNEECTRTFLGIEVGAAARAHLCALVKQVDEILDQYRLPIFYENPSFHVSVLWCLGNKVRELENIRAVLQDTFVEYATESPVSISVESITCKTGNKFFTFSLSS